MNNHEYSAGAWKYPAPKRQHSSMVTAAWVAAALIVSLLFAHYLVKAWNIELHDAAQVERMR